MNFSSISSYLDPSNWQQQVTHQVGIISSTGVSSQLPPPPPPPPPPQPHGVGGSGSIRPGSMTERARMANIPMPEAALKCPRCESTNTKFCYFNNYSLTQPRHFCKTCRRYWTRGGALRSVPVGGGYRRNKRSKGRGSKSPPVSSDRQQTSGSANSVSSSAIASNNSGGFSPQIPPLRFMSDFDIGGYSYGGGGLSAPTPAAGDPSFHLGNTNLGGGTSIGSLLGFDQQWRGGLQQQAPGQFPFSSSLDPFDGGGSVGGGDGFGWQMRPKLASNSRNLSQIMGNSNSVKMEEAPDHNQVINNVGRQFIGNEQYWSSGSMAWSDLSGFSSSSSTRNPL